MEDSPPDRLFPPAAQGVAKGADESDELMAEAESSKEGLAQLGQRPESDSGVDGMSPPPSQGEGAEHGERIPHELIDFRASGQNTEGRTGNFLFTVGNVGSGKSTLQAQLITRLWNHRELNFEYSSHSGDPKHDAILDAVVQNLASGFLPRRSPQGLIQEFNIRFGQRNRPSVPLNFVEISGEDIKSIVPGLNQSEPRLNELLEEYLAMPSVNRRFVFVSDASVNLTGSDRLLPRYSEDVLFNHLLRYLLALGLPRLQILFVAAKWDTVGSRYRNEKEYFETNFPQTRALIGASATISASYIPFSVGALDDAGGSQDSSSIIRRADYQYVDVLISWIYESLSGRTLRGFPRVKKTPWDRLKRLFA